MVRQCLRAAISKATFPMDWRRSPKVRPWAPRICLSFWGQETRHSVHKLSQNRAKDIPILTQQLSISFDSFEDKSRKHVYTLLHWQEMHNYFIDRKHTITSLTGNAQQLLHWQETHKNYINDRKRIPISCRTSLHAPMQWLHSLNCLQLASSYVRYFQ